MIVQIGFNIVMLLTVFVMWARLKRPPQEDPRMSRGLQLLQSKIAVMESLSDKTEAQFSNINSLIDKKTEKLQKILIKSEDQMSRLDTAMTKSMDVAEIFQDKIPHEDVIERKNSVQLITAARMAHAGHSIEEIVDKVKLPKPQVELICKVNKNDLIFDKDSLPEWVQKMESEQLDFVEDEAQAHPEASNFEDEGEQWVAKSNTEVLSTPNTVVGEELERIKKMGDEFKNLCTSYDQRQRQLDYEIENNLTKKMMDNAEVATHKVMENVGHISQKVATNASVVGHRVAENAGVVGQKVASSAGAVGQKVAARAGVVGQKIVDKAGVVLEASKENLKDAAEKSKVKIKKVKFPRIDSDQKDIF